MYNYFISDEGFVAFVLTTSLMGWLLISAIA